MKNSVSILTGHSILSLNLDLTELLNATVPIMSGREDGERIPLPNNGTSMRSPRPSRTTTGSLTLSISNRTEDHPISDAQLPTQDGGKCLD
jgi:hypothetical protein